MLIVIIFAGVRSGIFTATESAGVAVIYALLVTVLVYRSLGWAGFTEAVGGAVRTTGMVMLIIGTATAFGWLMALLQVPAQTVAFMRGITEDPIMTLLLINVILLVLGTFMDMAPLIMIGTPIFLPVVKALGMDPVQLHRADRQPRHRADHPARGTGAVADPRRRQGEHVGCDKHSGPFYVAMLMVLGLVTYIPALSLWLPAVFR